MFNKGVLKSVADIYRLTEDSLTPFFLNADSMEKEKDSLGAKKVYESIQSHKKMSLSVFIAGLDIEGIGETTVQKLIDAGYTNLEKLQNASVDSIASVYGFAEIMAKTFKKGLEENHSLIKELLEEGLVSLEETGEGKLTGKSFCFTGELVTMKRNDAEALVKKNGGSCKSSVTKDLSYLVTNDTTSGSSKNVKAAKLGIPVITEEEFLALIK